MAACISQPIKSETRRCNKLLARCPWRDGLELLLSMLRRRLATTVSCNTAMGLCAPSQWPWALSLARSSNELDGVSYKQMARARPFGQWPEALAHLKEEVDSALEPWTSVIQLAMMSCRRRT